MMNQKIISEVMKDTMKISDKVFENMRIYDINGKLSTIEFQTVDGQTIEN